MNTPSETKLYTPELLALAVALADYPFDPELALTGEAHSRSCGSSLEVGLSLDRYDQIAVIGMRVTACAVGQAAAAIFACSATGTTQDHVSATLSEIERWLAGQSELPEWPGLAALARAPDYAGRHGSILLPWRAANAALCKRGQAG